MGTSAVIAEIDSAGNFYGVTVHYDGYPSHVGPQLAGILNGPYGVSVGFEALFSYPDYSSLNCEQEETGDERYVEVPGVGLAYPEGDSGRAVQSFNEAFGFGDWTYVVTGAECESLEVYRGRALVSRVSTDDLLRVDWETIQRRGEALA